MIRKISKYILFVIAAFLIYSTLTVIMLNWINPQITSVIHSQSMNGLFISRDDYKSEWIDIDNVSVHFPLAVVSAEDQNFFWHSGFDLKQIQKAFDEMERNIRVRGASTITQQVAKNLFLWNDPSFLRKGIEAYYTVLLELFLSKKRILEIYINTAELGKNVYGIEAACRFYFNGSSERMYKNQAALIAAILPSPRKRSPAAPSYYVLRRANEIMRQMELIGGERFIKANLE